MSFNPERRGAAGAAADSRGAARSAYTRRPSATRPCRGWQVGAASKPRLPDGRAGAAPAWPAPRPWRPRAPDGAARRRSRPPRRASPDVAQAGPAYPPHARVQAAGQPSWWAGVPEGLQRPSPALASFPPLEPRPREPERSPVPAARRAAKPPQQSPVSRVSWKRGRSCARGRRWPAGFRRRSARVPARPVRPLPRSGTTCATHCEAERSRAFALPPRLPARPVAPGLASMTPATAAITISGASPPRRTNLKPELRGRSSRSVSQSQLIAPSRPVFRGRSRVGTSGCLCRATPRAPEARRAIPRRPAARARREARRAASARASACPGRARRDRARSRGRGRSPASSRRDAGRA